MSSWSLLAAAGAAVVCAGVVLRLLGRHGGVWVVAGALLAVPTGAVAWRDASTEHHLGRLASELIDRPGVRVQCQDPFWGEFEARFDQGRVRSGSNTAELRAQVCARLREPPGDDLEWATAVAVLAHEARPRRR